MYLSAEPDFLTVTLFAAFAITYILFKLFYKFKRRSNNPFARFEDIYSSLEEVQKGLKQQGLESSNLIIGIDFTFSNTHQGTYTFGGKSLHYIDEQGDSLNQYQNVIKTIGRTLSAFDEDGLIPVYGFGDNRTKDYSVFALKHEVVNYKDSRFSEMCHGFEEVLEVYNRVAPSIVLSGPTSFAPLIHKAINLCKESGRAEYQILLIICDGQVSNEVETAQAIVDASEWPISIICIGVGDGPWESMEEFDDDLPARKFDNFQFVDYNQVMKDALRKGKNPDVHFALHALMEVPQQYKAIKKLGLLGKSAMNPPPYRPGITPY